MTVIVAVRFRHQDRPHAVVVADSLYTNARTKKPEDYARDKLVAIGAPGPAIITGYGGLVCEVERARKRAKQEWQKNRSPSYVAYQLRREIIRARRDVGRSLSEGRSSALIVGLNKSLDENVLYEVNSKRGETRRITTTVLTRGSGAEDANLRLVREGVDLQGQGMPSIRLGRALYLTIAAAYHAKRHPTVGGSLQVMCLDPRKGIIEISEERCVIAERMIGERGSPSITVYECLENLLS